MFNINRIVLAINKKYANCIFFILINISFRFRSAKMTHNVPALGEVANFGTDYFLSKIKFLAKCKRVFTTKFAILPNACCAIALVVLETVDFFYY